MAPLARSPTPTRPQGIVEPAFAGAREGRLRFAADLGPGRHVADRERLWNWYHVGPEQPLVRADGVVVTDWHGVVRAHGPDGRLLWERDLAPEPDKPWAEFWGRLSHVDERDATWIVTRSGLTRLSPDGEPELVNEDLGAGGFAPGLGRLLPWGGFVRSYGTDEHYWTGHWPCCESVVELLDAEGRVVASHAMGLAPGRVHVVGRRIVATFYDANHDPSEREEALVLDEAGALVERRTRPEGAAGDYVRDLAEELAAVQGIGHAFVPPGGRHWAEGTPVAAPGGERAYSVSPEWNRTVRLLALGVGAEPVVALRDVSADSPSLDVDGVCYATRAPDGWLRLVAIGPDGLRLDVPVLAEPDLLRFAFDHGGRPAKVWADTRWFHAPTAIGPDRSTLVLTDLGGTCTLYCVE